jgi:hypothetical protein
VPSKPGYFFRPGGWTDPELGANLVTTFIGSLPVSISVRVTDSSGNGVRGVTIALSGDSVGSDVTDQNGNFFTRVAGGSNITITPSKSNFFFNPASLSFTNLRSDQTVGFTAVAIPLLLTEENSSRAIALDSVTWVRDPFFLSTPYSFSLDRRTRVILFAANVELRPGESLSLVTAQAEDSQQRFYPLTVEYVGKILGFDWLTQINVRLPDELQNAGDVWVSISLRGVSGNKALISIRQSQ